MSGAKDRRDAMGWPDEGFIRQAVEEAHPNALRLALYLQTQDPELAAMRVEQRTLRGGSMTLPSLARDDRVRLKEKALDYLRLGAPAARPAPDLAATEALLKLFGAPASTPLGARMAYEELGFNPQLRCVRWKRKPSAEAIAACKVLVVGAGISGVAVALQLKQLGLPFEIVERQGRVGGTWALNDYPEARVDVSNFIYQYRFEAKYPWRGAFAAQAEIRDYVEHVVQTHGLGPYLRLNTKLLDAEWDEDKHDWIATLQQGEAPPERMAVRAIVSASGLFSTPNMPALDGLDAFKGALFHTTDWDHAIDLSDKRVALIGTGSSGAQVMPHLARTARSLCVFQRTPNWILPMPGYHAPVSDAQRWMLAVMPHYWNWYCYAANVLDQQLEMIQERDAAWIEKGGLVSARNDALRAHLEDYARQQLSDRPDLLEHSIPNYPPAARRLVADNGWFEALKRPNVELVCDPIARIAENGVVLAEGALKEADIIVLGTGFKTYRYLASTSYRGAGGITPERAWAKDGARAYLGLTMPDFPNLFMCYGPNGQPRTGSFPSWAEIWARYAVGLLAAMLERGAEALEVKRGAFAAYNAELDAAMPNLLWGSPGAGSYYLNEHGRSGVNMPWRVEDYFGRTLEPDTENYDFR